MTKKMPKHVKEYHVRGKKIDMLLAATKETHTDAYSALLDVIRDKETNRPDHEKLGEAKVREDALDAMIDNYKKSAIKKLTDLKAEGEITAPKKGTFEEEIFLKKYVGRTRKELRDTLEKYKDNYKQETHEGIRDKLIEKQEEELGPLKHGHLKKEHIGDILDYAGVKEYFVPDHIAAAEHVAPLLDMVKAKGEKLSIGDLKNLGLPDAYFTRETREKMKELKAKHKKTMKEAA